MSTTLPQTGKLNTVYTPGDHITRRFEFLSETGEAADVAGVAFALKITSNIGNVLHTLTVGAGITQVGNVIEVQITGAQSAVAALSGAHYALSGTLDGKKKTYLVGQFVCNQSGPVCFDPVQILTCNCNIQVVLCGAAGTLTPWVDLLEYYDSDEAAIAGGLEVGNYYKVATTGGPLGLKRGTIVQVEEI